MDSSYLPHPGYQNAPQMGIVYDNNNASNASINTQTDGRYRRIREGEEVTDDTAVSLQANSLDESCCKMAARILFPCAGVAVTTSSLLVAGVSYFRETNTDGVYYKVFFCIAAVNLVLAATIERVSSCFGDRMNGVTENALKGTFFPVLMWAGTFSLFKIANGEDSTDRF